MIRIHAISTGTAQVKDVQQDRRLSSKVPPLFNMLTASKWTDALPIYAWLIEHPEGLILVDTGETARTSEVGYFPWWHPYFRLAVRMSIRPDEEIGPQLQQLGFSPRDVRWVILTHLHTDHAGGLAHFPSSEILVARGEYQVARGFNGKLAGYLPQRWPDWFAPRLIDLETQPVGPFPKSLTLTAAGDITVLLTPGHTPHHLSVLVRDGEISYLLAGDSSYTEQLMVEATPDGVAPDTNVARQTLKRIRAYAQSTPLVYLPSHDPDSARRLANKTTVLFPESLKML